MEACSSWLTGVVAELGVPGGIALALEVAFVRVFARDVADIELLQVLSLRLLLLPLLLPLLLLLLLSLLRLWVGIESSESTGLMGTLGGGGGSMKSVKRESSEMDAVDFDMAAVEEEMFLVPKRTANSDSSSKIGNSIGEKCEEGSEWVPIAVMFGNFFCFRIVKILESLWDYEEVEYSIMLLLCVCALSQTIISQFSKATQAFCHIPIPV